MNLSRETTYLAARAIREHLHAYRDGELVGVSRLARGADSIFAKSVLDSGGALEVVLPSRDYRATKVKPDHAEQFDSLLAKAALVRIMDFGKAGRDAYVAANEAVLGPIDALVAVWDGQPATGTGGTADVVEEARSRDIPITVIWPDGASRQ